MLTVIFNLFFIDDSFKAYLEILVSRLQILVQAKSLAALTVYIWVR